MNHEKVNTHHDKIQRTLMELRYTLLDASDSNDADACHGAERSLLRDYLSEGAKTTPCPIEKELYKACAEVIK